MKKKAIAMLLAASMVPSLFTGCTDSPPSTAPTETVASTATIETEAPESIVIETTTVPTEPPTTPSTEPDETEPTISVVQQNSINMLNYLAFVAEDIYTAKDNRLILEDIYTALMNEINPGAVDDTTQDQLRNLRSVIKRFLQIDTKRERLQYLYSQEKAAAMRNAVPDPLAVLTMANSLDWKRLAASVAFTVVDSYNNYKAASEAVDQEYLLSGWELDDEEKDTIQKNREYAFDYMVDIVQMYGTTEFTAKQLGMLTLNEKAVEEFAAICAIEEVYLKQQRLEAVEQIYKQFGNYWIELADCYYELAEKEHDESYYVKCLDCVAKYNELATGIFRQDFIIVPILPKAIVAAQTVYKGEEYISNVAMFADALVDNTHEDEWALRYFAAQVYMDLYSKTDEPEHIKKAYLKKAYDLAKNNVSQLIDEQQTLNITYLQEVKKLGIEKPNYDTVPKSDKKAVQAKYEAEKAQIDAYNAQLVETRKTELPPLYEPLVLNCDLLFALAEQLEIESSEQRSIQNILQTSSSGVFWSKSVNNHYSFEPEAEQYSISYKKNKMEIPAELLTQGAKIEVIVETDQGSQTFTDWEVTSVERPKLKKNQEHSSIEAFVAHISSDSIKKFDWEEGMTVTIIINNGEQYDPITIQYKTVAGSWLNPIVFKAI